MVIRMLKVVFEENLVFEIGRSCLIEIRCKSRWWSRCHHPDSIPTLVQCQLSVVLYSGPWMAYNVRPCSFDQSCRCSTNVIQRRPNVAMLYGHTCSRFGLFELVNLTWLREVSLNGMVKLGMNVNGDFWKKHLCNTICEVGKQTWKMSLMIQRWRKIMYK